jgi:hypothetical protein
MGFVVAAGVWRGRAEVSALRWSPAATRSDPGFGFGVEEGPPLTLQKILLIGIVASGVHGFTMGLYAWLDRGGEG